MQQKRRWRGLLDWLHGNPKQPRSVRREAVADGPSFLPWPDRVVTLPALHPSSLVQVAAILPGGVAVPVKQGKIRRLPLEVATKPRDGEVLVDRYWAVDDQGIYWFTLAGRGWSPQCNSNPAIAEHLFKMYPGCRVEHIPIVYAGRWSDEYGHEPFTGLEGVKIPEAVPVKELVE